MVCACVRVCSSLVVVDPTDAQRNSSKCVPPAPIHLLLITSPTRIELEKPARPPVSSLKSAIVSDNNLLTGNYQQQDAAGTIQLLAVAAAQLRVNCIMAE